MLAANESAALVKARVGITVTSVHNPSPDHRARTWAGPIALVAAGLLFLAYPILRPYTDETTMAGARAFASGTWIAAHLCAVVGFILLTLALPTLRAWLGSGPGAGAARLAVVVTQVGVGLTLPYYGAEVFALNALGERVTRTGDVGLLGLAEAIRMGPVQTTLFGAGLLLLAVGTVAAAVAVWRGGVRPRWAGTPLATGFVLFLPQFFAPSSVRVAHGALLAVGFVVLAVALNRSGRDTRPETPIWPG